MVERALQISTTSISMKGRTYVVQYMIGTSCRSGLVCELVLWVTGRFTYFSTMSYRVCWQGFTLKWSSTSAGTCTFGSKSMVYAWGGSSMHVLADLCKMCSIMPITTNG